MHILEKLNENKLDFFLIFLIISLPICLLTGSLVVNSCVILIDIFFLYKLYIEKNFNYLNNKYFISLIIFWLYLFFNLFFSIDVNESLPRTIGFIRFILLSFVINYFFFHQTDKIKNLILNCWTVIFLFVSLDLIFEFIFGFNILGFKSEFEGRLSGVLNNELKIGHYYSVFILLSLVNINEILNKNSNNFSKFLYIENLFYFIFILFTFISLIIGERSNFIKVFFMSSLFIFFINKKNIFKKIVSLILIISIFFIIIFNNTHFKHRVWDEFLGPLFKNPIELVFNSKYGSHYKVAIEVFDNNKLYGVGLKNYRHEVSTNTYKQDSSISNHPHQTHFEILSELGLFGYLLFITIFIFLIFSSTKIFFSKREDLHLCGLLFVIATLVPLIPSGSFFETYGATLFWLSFSFILPRKN
jgi:O-antigen ligase